MTPPRVSLSVGRTTPQSRVMAWIGDLPTTQVRVLVTLIVVAGTAAKYFLSETWEPSYEWLAFLVVMSGLDVAQFARKRTTDAAYVAATQGAPVLPDPDPPSPAS